jgi:hypothetical protein
VVRGANLAGFVCVAGWFFVDRMWCFVWQTWTAVYTV